LLPSAAETIREGRQVKFGILTPVLSLTPGLHSAWELNGTIEDVGRIASTAERLGYEYLSCSEHVAIPSEPGARPIPSGLRYWDPLPTFGYLAARTSRIRFTTLVIVLSYHHPLDICKRYGTLDRVCGGRLNLGVGVGYLRPEFDLLGASYEDRNERSDDALRALKASFGRAVPEYEGDYFQFSGMCVDPCGVQADIPLWVGGRTKRSLRRALALGDVWSPFSLSIEQISDWLGEARSTDAWHEREKPMGVAVPVQMDPVAEPDTTRDLVAGWREAGVTHLSVRFVHSSLEHYLEQLEAMAELSETG
jgi:probable F420-dependent oxidoreductase